MKLRKKNARSDSPGHLLSLTTQLSKGSDLDLDSHYYSLLERDQSRHIQDNTYLNLLTEASNTGQVLLSILLISFYSQLF